MKNCENSSDESEITIYDDGTNTTWETSAFGGRFMQDDNGMFRYSDDEEESISSTFTLKICYFYGHWETYPKIVHLSIDSISQCSNNEDIITTVELDSIDKANKFAMESEKVLPCSDCFSVEEYICEF